MATWHEKNREWNAERDRAYHQANRAHRLAGFSRYYEANKEKLNAYNSAYYKGRPDRSRAKENNRRARLLSASGTHTAEDIRGIGEAQGWKCVYCRADIKTKNHLDHILPLKLGGGNGKDNLQLLCKPCNLRKGAKHPSAFKMMEAAHG